MAAWAVCEVVADSVWHRRRYRGNPSGKTATSLLSPSAFPALFLLTLVFSLLALTMLGVRMTTDICGNGTSLRQTCGRSVDTAVRWRTHRLQFSSGDRHPSSAFVWPSESVTPTSSAFDMHFVTNADRICDFSDEDDGLNATMRPPLYLIIVHSRPDESGRAQRDAIRATWAMAARPSSFADGRRTDFRVVFLVGVPPVVSETQSQLTTTISWMIDAMGALAKLRRENELYGDLLVADFVDSYRNLTVKSLVGMLWARKQCSSARYIVKADDDVFLLVSRLPEVVRRHLRPANGSGTEGGGDEITREAIVGSLNVNSTVQRRGLWRVDESQFAADRFPPYCSGNVYLMTSAAVDRLLAAATSVDRLSLADPFPLEDVYVTSILAASGGLRCQHDDAFPHWFVGPTRSNIRLMHAGQLLALHNVDFRRMYEIDKKLNLRAKRGWKIR